ncbi:MAG: acyloxyacyl hydrolase [Bacteroidales bacterium]
MRKFVLILFFSIFYVLPVTAQKNTNNPSFLAIKPAYGFILPHSKTIKHLASSNPYGFEADYGWFLLEDKDWQRCNCYSKAGISMLYTDFDNPDILGQSYNLILFAEPLLNYRGNWKTSIRMGAGVSYLTKVYDMEHNEENLFFSYPLSYLVHLDFNLTRFLSEGFYMFFYGKYNHISNGGVEQPNKGMNFPMFGAGMGYTFDEVDFEEKKRVPLEKPVPVIPYSGVYVTAENAEEEGRDRVIAIGTFIKARRTISRLNALTAGFEGIYDPSLYTKDTKASNVVKNSYYSFIAGHAFVFGKFMFSQEWGVYLYAPNYERRKHFQRYTLTYNIRDKIRAGVTLKAHAEVAENFNITVTYDFSGE